MTCYAYLFAAGSIQNYIFAGGKLRDVVAASDLLDQLTAGILEDVLGSLNITDSVTFSRRAGGALYAVSEDHHAIQKLADIWPLVASGMLPGLDMVMTQASGETEYDAVKNGLEKLDALKHFPVPQLPLVPPVAQWSQRTGEGAIVDSKQSLLTELPNGTKVRENISKATFTKRKFAANGASGKRKGVRRKLREKFTLSDNVDLHWPKALSEEEGLKSTEVLPLHKNSYVALVHIDGNGLGQLLIKLNQVAHHCKEDYSEAYLAISMAIAEITQDAAAQAMEEVVLPAARGNNSTDSVVPAVPLVLGGDDITIILVAEYALAFTQAYIEAFEHLSSERLQDVKTRFSHLPHLCGAIPDYLTASAGVAFCKATYPFQYASDLAENLCRKAKKMAAADACENQSAKSTKESTNTDDDQPYTPTPAAICWHRVTTTSITSVEDIYRDELSYQKVQHHHQETVTHGLSLGAYSLGKQASTLPNFEAFMALQYDVLGVVKKTDAAGDAYFDETLGEVAARDQINSPSSRLGRLREYMGYLKTNPYQAEQILERLWEVDPMFMTRFREHLNKIWPGKPYNNEFAYTLAEGSKGSFDQGAEGSVSLIADLIASAAVVKTHNRKNKQQAGSSEDPQ